MSKLVDKYNNLKLKDDKYYLFKVGIFYIFIDDDAKDMSDLLSLKLTHLNDSVYKCGFPINALDKYKKILDYLGVNYEIIDNIDSNIIEDNELDNYLDYIKNVDINSITGLEALCIINELKKLLKE